jgi:uncharacterized protein
MGLVIRSGCRYQFHAQELGSSTAMTSESRKLNELRLPPGHSEEELVALIAARSGLSVKAIREAGYRIIRRSVDARRKNSLAMQYNIEIGPFIDNPQGIVRLQLPVIHINRSARPVVAGAGPAGLFAALALALAGCQPLILEQGKPVDERQADVARFWQNGQLNPLSNVQFGEGGAGTFSDGKLTTGIKDPRCRAVLEEMVLAGAPPDILVQQKPHVGTDYLRRVLSIFENKSSAWAANSASVAG